MGLSKKLPTSKELWKTVRKPGELSLKTTTKNKKSRKSGSSGSLEAKYKEMKLRTFEMCIRKRQEVVLLENKINNLN